MGWIPIGTMLGGAQAAQPPGLPGPKGQDASAWLDGTGAPGPLLGVQGDWYFQRDTSDVWRKLSMFFGVPPSWRIVANTKGAQGKDGKAGKDGLPGMPGNPGASIKGDQGGPGVDGVAGMNASLPGPKGQDAASWLTGTGTPAASLGLQNDFYLQTEIGVVWRKLIPSFGVPPTWTIVATIKGATGTAGTTGATGAQVFSLPPQKGQDGATWLAGSANPDANTGKIGDLYFQTTPSNTQQLSTGQIMQTLKGDPGKQGDRGPSGLNVGSDGKIWVPPVPQAWSFSLKNSASSLAVDRCIRIYAPVTGNDEWSIAFTPIPTVTPYDCIFYLKTVYWVTNFMSYGVFWRNSALNTFKSIGLVTNLGLQSYPIVETGKGTDGTAHITADYALSAANVNMVQWNWFKLTDDGTNQTYSIGPDGFNWYQTYTQARNTDVTPNQVGFFFNVRNTAALDGLVACWHYFGG